MWFYDRWILTFRRNILPASSGVGSVCSSETLLHIYQAIRWHNPEDPNVKLLTLIPYMSQEMPNLSCTKGNKTFRHDYKHYISLGPLVAALFNTSEIIRWLSGVNEHPTYYLYWEAFLFTCPVSVLFPDSRFKCRRTLFSCHYKISETVRQKDNVKARRS
jgi:hypothetical protein